MKIYFDMDDVLVGLSSYMVKRANETFHTAINWEDLKSQNFKVLEGDVIPEGWFQNELNKKGTFKFPKPIQNSVEQFEIIYNNITSLGYKVYIASTPQFNDWCCREKINWVKHYLPFFPVQNIIFIQDKSLLANEDRILIDDFDTNIKNFISKNGKGIHFNSKSLPSVDGSIEVRNWKELYETLRIIFKFKEDK